MSERNGGGHGRRRHRHGPLYRFKRTISHHRWIAPAAVLLAVAVIAAGLWMRSAALKGQTLRVASNSPVNVGGSYHNISYKGKEYRYNSRITAILYAGLDSNGDLHQTTKYTLAPRADSISLIVLDEYHRRMTIIALNRDTMTPIRKYTLNGKDRGMLTDHLGYAYTYGDGGTVSAKNLCEAVSSLLYGIPVHDYVVTNLDSLPILGNLIGPLSVKAPNDDLVDDGYAKGDTVRVDASNLEWFVRHRDTEKDLSNVGRMERQQAYINAAVDSLRKVVEDDPSGSWRIMERAEGSMRTSITRNRYLDLIQVLQNTSYVENDYYIPEGRQVVASDHDEFYPDEEALLQKVVDIFYIEK